LTPCVNVYSALIQEHKKLQPNKKRRGVAALIGPAGYHTLPINKHKRPTPQMGRERSSYSRLV